MALNVHVIECNEAPSEAPTEVGQHWVNESTGEIWLSNGTSSLLNWILITEINSPVIETIPGGTTQTLDVISLANFCAVKYIICYFNATEDKWASLEIMAGKITSTTIEHTTYAKLGNFKIMDFDVIINGTSIELVATNNEAYDIDVKTAKRLL